MALFIEIIAGNDLGKRFKAVSGLKIGRSLGDITVNEPKMSGLHAQIKRSENNRLYLIDRESSNGIKIKGVRVQKLELTPGATFQIGSTVFLVVEGVDEDEVAVQPVNSEDWKQILKTHIPNLKIQEDAKRPPLQILPKPLVVEFLEGALSSQVIRLGYLPRSFGLCSPDIEILDPESPDIAFEIKANDEGSIEFVTDYPDQVLLNGTSSPKELIQNNDIIRVGSTLIQIKADND